jgi:hypothetical protein
MEDVDSPRDCAFNLGLPPALPHVLLLALHASPSPPGGKSEAKGGDG